jgi:succinyl-CoA synthetase beta subunit
VTILSFEVLSGGTVNIDLEKCRACSTKVCVVMCSSPNMGDVLTLKEGLPALKKSRQDIARGGCTECLGCELECSLKGQDAITIILPILELDAE